MPDLRGRVPVHQGNGVILAEAGGAEEVTLTVNQIPAHTHPLLASTGPGNLNAPGGNVTGESAAVKIYYADEPTANMAAQAIGPAGGSQPHSNFQPYLCINFIISLFGIYPSQTLRNDQWLIPSLQRFECFRFNFAPKGWAFCDGQAAAHFAEYGAVFAARYDLRR